MQGWTYRVPIDPFFDRVDRINVLKKSCQSGMRSSTGQQGHTQRRYNLHDGIVPAVR